MKKATKNLNKLDRSIQKAIKRLVRFGIESAETPNYRTFLVKNELILAVHLDRFPEWKCGSVERG